MTYHEISDKHLKESKAICEEKGITYETEAEYKDAANNLIGFFDILIQTDMEERTRKERLKSESKGFVLEGKGRTCSLCGHSVYDSDGWYDKWGFKCMNCQDAVNKKKIPGSLCGDYDHKKYVTESMLSYLSGVHHRTIRKLINQGKINVRRIPNGPNLILRKDNPNLQNVIGSIDN